MVIGKQSKCSLLKSLQLQVRRGTYTSGSYSLRCICRYQCSSTIIPVNDKHGNRIKTILVHAEVAASPESQAEAKDGKDADTRRQDLLARAPQAYLMTQGSGSCMILRGLEGAEVICTPSPRIRPVLPIGLVCCIYGRGCGQGPCSCHYEQTLCHAGHADGSWGHQPFAFASIHIVCRSPSNLSHFILLSKDFGMQEVTGYGLEDMQGQSCLSLCGPESGHKAMRELSNAHLTGHSCRSKMLCYRRDGAPVW